MRKFAAAVVALGLSGVAAPALACADYVTPAMTPAWLAANSDVAVEGRIVRRLPDNRRRGPDWSANINAFLPTNQAWTLRIDRKLRDRVGIGETAQIEVNRTEEYYCDGMVQVGVLPEPGIRVRMYLTLDRKTHAFYRVFHWEEIEPKMTAMSRTSPPKRL